MLSTLDPDRLRVHERIRSEMRKFSTIPAVFDAADRYTWIGFSDAVDEHTTCINIPCNPAGQLSIGGPDIAAPSGLACVRRTDRRIDVRYLGHRGNRTKRLLVERRHALGNSAQHGRRVKGALARHWLPAAQHACSFPDAPLHLFMQRRPKAGPSHRSG